MFGRRPDGKRLKERDFVMRMIPILMKNRTEATNFFLHTQQCKSIDDFIAVKKKEGKDYTYRDIAVAFFVRIFAEHPKFNRFYIKDRLYQRNHIDFSMMVHKSLKKGDKEVCVKVRFSGLETLSEIKDKLDGAIIKAINTEDPFGKSMERIPTFMVRWITRLMRLFDRWGMLSDKFLFENSPFHSSIFFADLKSIHVNYVYHHLTNFGNCGFFATMGKEHMAAIYDEKDGTIKAGNIFELGISMDERFVDGLYYRNMVKGAKRIMDNPYELEEPARIPKDEIPTRKKRKHNDQTGKVFDRGRGDNLHVKKSRKKRNALQEE